MQRGAALPIVRTLHNGSKGCSSQKNCAAEKLLELVTGTMPPPRTIELSGFTSRGGCSCSTVLMWPLSSSARTHPCHAITDLRPLSRALGKAAQTCVPPLLHQQCHLEFASCRGGDPGAVGERCCRAEECCRAEGCFRAAECYRRRLATFYRGEGAELALLTLHACACWHLLRSRVTPEAAAILCQLCMRARRSTTSINPAAVCIYLYDRGSLVL